MPTDTPPTLTTSATDSTARPTYLAQYINDVNDAVNKLGAAGLTGWTSYTPALTTSGAGADPGIGTSGNGAVQFGRYCKIGRLIVAQFGIRFATTGTSKGSGTYLVSTPVTMKTAGQAAGLTSDSAGFGLIWRGYSSLDLVQGAHLPVRWQLNDSSGDTLVAVYTPGSQGGIIDQATKTSTETGSWTSANDVSSLSVSVTPVRAGARYRIAADLLVYKTSGTGDIYVQITDGSGTVLRRTAVYLPTYGTAFGTGLAPAHIEYIDEAPTVGAAKTYKVQAYGVDGAMGVFASSSAPGTIVVEELAGVSTSGLSEQTDYVTDSVPWEWDDGNGGAELWGVIVGESAA